MLPWNFSEEGAAEKHMAQLQHNMLVAGVKDRRPLHHHRRRQVRGIFADPLYQHLLLTAERKFWRCVQSGEPPRLFGIEPPRAKG
jgi:hypothetical protein